MFIRPLPDYLFSSPFDCSEERGKGRGMLNGPAGGFLPHPPRDMRCGYYFCTDAHYHARCLGSESCMSAPALEMFLKTGFPIRLVESEALTIMAPLVESLLPAFILKEHGRWR